VDPDALELGQGDAPTLLGGPSAHDALCDTDVVEHGQVREEVELLKNHADFGAHRVDVAGLGVDVDAVNHDQSAGRRLEVVDAAQHSALSRARWADDHQYLAAPDPQTDVVDGAQVLELFDQMLDDDDVVAHELSPIL